MSQMNPREELEKAQRVAEALTCLANYIDDIDARYEPLIIALFGIRHGHKIGIQVDCNGTDCFVQGRELVGGIEIGVEALSEVIQSLQLEEMMGSEMPDLQTTDEE